LGTTECPEPLCPAASPERPPGTPERALPLRRRSYGLMRQTAFLRASRFPSAPGLCRLLSPPAGRRPFPTLFLHPLRRRLDPYPAASLRCTCPFLPGGHRPRATGNALGRRECPCHATSTGSRISGLQSFASLQAPTLARPPSCTHRGRIDIRPGSRAVYTTHSTSGYPTVVWYRYVTDLGNCHGWTLTSWLAVLSAAPPQYGFKAGLSDGAFPHDVLQSRRQVCARPAHSPWRSCTLRSESETSARWSTTIRETLVSLPQGPSLRSGLFCPGPSSLSRPHPPRSQAHRDFAARRLIRDAFAVRARLERRMG